MSYKDFPPYEFFMTVLRHAPDVAYFYLKIWSAKAKDNKLLVDRKAIYSQFLVTPITFKRKTGVLMEEGLLSMQESPYFFEIDFTNYEPDADDIPKSKTKESQHASKLTPIN
jgi:hypothetical protein